MKSHLITALFIFFSGSILWGQQNIGVVSISEASNISYNTAFNSVSSSFSIVGGNILVKAMIGGKEGSYLLDSGAESIILNRLPASENSFEALGLNGAARAEEVVIPEFVWASVSFTELGAFNVDLSELESQMGVEIAGIIGLNLLGQGALAINFEAQILEFRESPRPKQMRKEGWEQHALGQAGHLLTVAMKLDGKKVNFGLDTGASLNLIGGKQFWSFKDKKLKLTGIHNNESEAQLLNIDQVRLSKEPISTGPIYYTASEVFAEQFDNQISGLLGFPFFEKNEVVLDLRKGILYFRSEMTH